MPSYGFGSGYGSGYGSSYPSYYPSYISRRRSRYGGARYGYNYGNRERYSPRNSYLYGRPRRRPYSWLRDLDSDYNRGNWGRELPEREPTPEPMPTIPEVPVVEIAEPLLVKDIDFHIQENVESNHTDHFECTDEDRDSGEAPELVVRRGNFMKLTVKFDRPYDKDKHDLKLCFTIGEEPMITKGTMELFKVDEDGVETYDQNTWGAYLKSRSGNDIEIMVHIACKCIVGEWNLSVKSIYTGKDGSEDDKVLEYKHNEDITILFNPWCKEDGVYMEDSDLLKEYVTNESGCVYFGSSEQRGARSWNYGQFEEGILDVCLTLLRRGFNETISRDMANPVLVSRILVQIINSSDDNGVLIGNWSGDYTGGVKPTTWIGSPAILKQFNKKGSVKFGQCWVFACLTTTVCRCLGIPCRNATNYSSAHDKEQSMCIEKILWINPNNGKVEQFKDEKMNVGLDSVWNFHVWNEAWMSRPDLGEKELDGWQAIDATPQEPSEGVFTCGPCPVLAIKQGRVDLKYDTAFVFCEVNADHATFMLHNDNTVDLIELDKTKIGKFISTKVPDGKPYKDKSYNRLSWSDRANYEELRRLDITDGYKYPEGSKEERMAVEKAFSMAKLYFSLLDPYVINTDSEKVTFAIDHSKHLMIGSDLLLEIKARNEGTQPRDIIDVTLKVSAEPYTGIPEEHFYERTFDSFQLNSGQEAIFKVQISADNYFSHLIEQANIYIEVTARIVPLRNSDELIVSNTYSDMRFRRPDLDVEGPEKARLREPVDFVVSFKNPAPVPLTNCRMSMGSSGFRDIDAKSLPDVGVGETYKGVFTMIPKRWREHEVTFTFDSTELQDVSGSTSIEISRF